LLGNESDSCSGDGLFLATEQEQCALFNMFSNKSNFNINWEAAGWLRQSSPGEKINTITF
jgi:hypothetical protein